MKSFGNGDFTPIEMPKMYREDYALCNYDDRSVYVSGGTIGPDRTRTVEKLNMKEDRWEQIQPMNERRAFHSSCSLKNAIYVFCGRDYGKVVNSIEKLVVEGPDAS